MKSLLLSICTATLLCAAGNDPQSILTEVSKLRQMYEECKAAEGTVQGVEPKVLAESNIKIKAQAREIAQKNGVIKSLEQTLLSRDRAYREATAQNKNMISQLHTQKVSVQERETLKRALEAAKADLLVAQKELQKAGGVKIVYKERPAEKDKIVANSIESNEQIKSLQRDLAAAQATITNLQNTKVKTVPNNKVVEKIVYKDRPVAKEKVIEKVVYKDRDVVKEKIVYKDRPVVQEKIVEKIVYKDRPVAKEKVIEKVVYKDRDVVKEKIVYKDRPVIQEKVVYKDRPVVQEKIVEKIVYKDRPVAKEKVIEKVVYKDRDVVKEKIVYKDRPVIQEKVVYKDRPVVQEKIVEKIVYKELPASKNTSKTIVKAEEIKQQPIKQQVSNTKAIEEQKRWQVDKLKLEAERKKSIPDPVIKKSSPSAYRMATNASIYSTPNGVKVDTWESGRSFTSGTSYDGWVKITGYFVNRVWQAASEDLWVKESDVIRR